MGWRWLPVRCLLVGLCLGSILSGCGGGEMSLTEYVDRLNAIVDRARQQYEVLVATPQGGVLVAEGAQLSDFTPQDLQSALERMGEIEAEVTEAVDAIEPPRLVADLHDLWFSDTFASARENLTIRAGTAADWEELSETTEMAAYRAALASDKQLCTDFQAELDATEERGVFADNPWLPGELKEVVAAVIGCAGYPEHPENVYRPPAASTP
jgi:hypothetical protein